MSETQTEYGEPKYPYQTWSSVGYLKWLFEEDMKRLDNLNTLHLELGKLYAKFSAYVMARNAKGE
jgi:hypothetical protein